MVPVHTEPMISGSSALGIATVALGMVLTPGPNMMYLVSRSLVQGRLAGFVSLAGVITGFLFYVLLTALGLAVLFATVPILFVIVKLAGAAYLLWLAIAMLRGSRAVFRATDDGGHSVSRLYGMGLATCLLNPKMALLYVALLPQFLDPAAGSLWSQTVQLGLVQVVVAGFVNACWVLAASQVGRLLARSRAAERAVRLVVGGMLAWIAVHLGLAQPARD
jgi:threonine/homoserine/homoserine lactone efflux protein